MARSLFRLNFASFFFLVFFFPISVSRQFERDGSGLGSGFLLGFFFFTEFLIRFFTFYVVLKTRSLFSVLLWFFFFCCGGEEGGGCGFLRAHSPAPHWPR